MSTIEEHYAAPGLLERIERGLAAAGTSTAAVTIDDLGPVDEFHLLGPIATAELIELLGVGADARVLDVGAGLGGPARRLARATGCHVTGVDLSADFCTAGNAMNDWVGLADRVQLDCADATRLAYPDGSFDAAWTIHVGMNIADKAALYTSVARVLAEGAPFVVFDLMGTGRGDVEYPMPWAATADQSFLATAGEVTEDLCGAGFEIVEVRDRTVDAVEFLEQNAARVRAAGGPPPLGLHLVIGPQFAEILGRVRGEMAEGRLAPTIIHARKG